MRAGEQGWTVRALKYGDEVRRSAKHRTPEMKSPFIRIQQRNRESLHTMWRYVQSPDAVVLRLVQILRIAIVEVAQVGRAGSIPLKGIGCKDALLISIF